ncbi:MAG: AbrB/MazE/SpoVT family DNA-binding domain-containing protein [Nanoarchaeota archaeon]
MIEISSRLRRWGNSFGIVVPGKAAEEGHIKEGDEVTAILIKKKVNLREMFGKHKFKKSVEEMMRETDRELYDD